MKTKITSNYYFLKKDFENENYEFNLFSWYTTENYREIVFAGTKYCSAVLICAI